MGRRGPKPKPTKVLEASGSWLVRHRGDEPMPDVEVPDPPDWFVVGSPADLEWQRVTGELQKLEIIATIDRSALIAYCLAYQRLCEAEEQIRNEGITISGSTGSQVKHPAVSVLEKAIDQIYRGAQLFGMTPSARVGLRAKSKTESKDDKSRFFSHKKEVS